MARRPEAQSLEVFDTTAEVAVASTLLLHPDDWAEIAGIVSPADFHDRRIAAVVAAVEQLSSSPDMPAPDQASIHRWLVANGEDHNVVSELLGSFVGSRSMLRHHAGVVAQRARARRMIAVLADAQERLYRGDPGDVARELAEIVEREATMPGELPLTAWTLSQVLELHSKPEPWLIPGLLRRKSRLILVAPEGGGKSVLTRQIALASAAGVHPFDDSITIPRLRVLIVDAENDLATITSEASHDGSAANTTLRGLTGVLEALRPGWDRDAVMIWSRPEGLDLRSSADRMRLSAAISVHKPDLVVLSPLYKLHSKGSREDHEQVAADVQRTLDALRARFGVALVIEHHAPKPQMGVRDWSPFGSSLWMRWPELGVAMRPPDDAGVSQIQMFRGSRYRTAWPQRLRRGRYLPWVAEWNDSGALLRRMCS